MSPVGVIVIRVCPVVGQPGVVSGAEPHLGGGCGDFTGDERRMAAAAPGGIAGYPAEFRNQSGRAGSVETEAPPPVITQHGKDVASRPQGGGGIE
ncbi:hypothetical protein SDC9_148072 [bioreactor metagenome]|uniref:Uncharacterized protein n=1 Tax=bioreactor metagenome TaxID=1076179 RepID=A0A645EJI2_9ZZZZ